MEAHPEHPHGCRGALVLPNLITIHVQGLCEQVSECHGHHSLRPARFSNPQLVVLQASIETG